MCRHISVELLCADEFTHVFPFTLSLIPLIISPCKDVMRVRELEQAQIDADSDDELDPLPPVWIHASRCPNFDLDYVRCERIFWTSCGCCIKSQGDKVEGFTDEDLHNVVQYNRLLVIDLVKTLQTRPYEELVRVLPTEFGIKRRWVLSGSRWVEAPPPTEDDAIGPDPPYDSKLDGLQWWLEQGMGGEVDDEIWRVMRERYGPIRPKDSSGRRNPPKASADSPDYLTEDSEGSIR
ncbi:hypothetical protein GGR54DRAFT_596550 [Hypoxylon sp. NC1633]|nr:hypothetical protein GGR54DRAFT_596550 [Hypoxylon sp. NC1633]